MELEIFKPSSDRSTDEVPYLRIHKTGNISVSKGAVKLLQVKVDSGFLFAQDKKTKDWYICLGQGEDVLKVRQKEKGKDQNITFNSSQLAKQLMEASKAKPGTASVKIKIAKAETEEGDSKWYGLLTSSATLSEGRPTQNQNKV